VSVLGRPPCLLLLELKDCTGMGLSGLRNNGFLTYPQLLCADLPAAWPPTHPPPAEPTSTATPPSGARAAPCGPTCSEGSAVPSTTRPQPGCLISARALPAAPCVQIP
jgi:hypothetical protein